MAIKKITINEANKQLPLDWDLARMAGQPAWQIRDRDGEWNLCEYNGIIAVERRSNDGIQTDRFNIVL